VKWAAITIATLLLAGAALLGLGLAGFGKPSPSGGMDPERKTSVSPLVFGGAGLLFIGICGGVIERELRRRERE